MAVWFLIFCIVGLLLWFAFRKRGAGGYSRSEWEKWEAENDDEFEMEWEAEDRAKRRK